MVCSRNLLQIGGLVVLLTLPFTLSFSAVSNPPDRIQTKERFITSGSKLKEEYRQNEDLVFHATILNNDTNRVNLTSLWLLLTVKREEGGTPAPEKRESKNFSYLLYPNETQTVSISLSLDDVSPATYNVTCYFETFVEEKIYVCKGREIELRSALEIPPMVWVVLGIAIATILVFVGWYFSGKIG